MNIEHPYILCVCVKQKQKLVQSWCPEDPSNSRIKESVFSGWSRARTAEPWNPEVFCSRSCFVPSFILLSLYVKLLFTNLHFSLQQIKPVSPLVHCTTAQMDKKRKNICEAEDRRRTFTLKMNSLCEHNKYDSTQPIIHTVCSGFDSQRIPASCDCFKDSRYKLLFYFAVKFSSIRWQSLAIKTKRERYLDLNVRLSSIPVNMSGSCSTKQVSHTDKWWSGGASWELSDLGLETLS